MKISFTNFNSEKKLDSQMRFFRQATCFLLNIFFLLKDVSKPRVLLLTNVLIYTKLYL